MMTVVSKYRKATADLIVELLKDADRLNIKLDKLLHGISEDTLKQALEELKELEKNGKIDLRNGIDLSRNEGIYRTLKEIENNIWNKFMDYCWIGQQIIADSLIQTQLNTFNTTYQIFGYPELQVQYGTKESNGLMIIGTHDLQRNIQIPWCKDGKIYSQRLHNNLANLQLKLTRMLNEGITRGKGIEWIERAWREITKSGAYEIARLLKTETMAFWGTSTKSAYLDMGIEYVMIVNDVACNAICVEFVDAEPIPLVEAEIGGMLPPYHPNCACSFIAYTEETK